ncbi:SPOC like C-terminal domain-containing protein [Dichotomocladium elegans]|nr:SPOC like C-terminal domain-containing protein [Dichotomocladium elegans]
MERLDDIPNVGHPYFIYPDEEAYNGSTRAFAALLRKMLEKRKMGVCTFTPRSNALTSIALLYPQRETFDENGIQDMPPGFHIIRMPFSEDIRYLPVASTQSATEEEINLTMKAIFGDDNKAGMKVRSKTYDPERFENPGNEALQLQYSVLQSLALNKPLVEEIHDQTLPKADVIDERIGQNLKKLSSILMEDAEEEVPAVSQKRKVADVDDGSESQSSSRRRLTTKSVEEHYQDQTLNKCLVVTLKEWLEANGIKPRPRKNDLIVQVCDVLDKRQSGA